MTAEIGPQKETTRDYLASPLLVCEVIVGTTSNCLPTSVPVLPILLRAILYSVQYLRTPPTYKCPHGRPCYFLSTNWPTVIYGSKYFFPNIFIFLFFLYSSSSSMDASNARKASITSLNHGCSCGSSWNNV